MRYINGLTMNKKQVKSLVLYFFCTVPLLSLTYKVLTTSQPSYLNNLISVQPLSSTEYPPLIGCHPFSPTYHLLIENHRSLICIIPSLESTPWFIPSASPVMSRLTPSFTCQLISIIITTLITHHSFTFSLQAQNLPFQQILPTLDFFYLPDCLHDNGTGPGLSCSSFYF